MTFNLIFLIVRLYIILIKKILENFFTEIQYEKKICNKIFKLYLV